MDSKDFVLSTMRKLGREAALNLQDDIPYLTGTEIVAQSDFLPDFNPERQYLNFKPGYVCKSAAGNAVKLLQPYDSAIYTQQPEELTAQWGFYWSTDPTQAKPFIKSATSPYNKNECCVFDGVVYQSTMDNNVYSPAEYPAGWREVI